MMVYSPLLAVYAYQSDLLRYRWKLNSIGYLTEIAANLTQLIFCIFYFKTLAVAFFASQYSRTPSHKHPLALFHWISLAVLR